jgi:hypothetical protein
VSLPRRYHRLFRLRQRMSQNHRGHFLNRCHLSPIQNLSRHCQHLLRLRRKLRQLHHPRPMQSRHQ